MAKTGVGRLFLLVGIPGAVLLAVAIGWLVARGPAAAELALLGAGVVVPTAWAAARLGHRATAWRSARPEVGGPALDFLLALVFLEATWGGLWRGPLGLRIADLVLVGLLLWVIVERPLLRERQMRPLVVAFALVLGGALLALSRTETLASDAQAIARAAFVMLVVPFVLIRLITTERRLVLVMLAMVFSVAVAAIAAVLYKVTGLWLLPLVDQTEGVRAYGLSDHPLLFGIASGAALPLAVALVLSTRGAPRLVAAATVPLLAAGLVMSASRAPMLATAVGLLGLLAYTLRQRRRATVALVAVAVGAAVGLAAILAPESVSRLSDATVQKSNNDRLAILDRAVHEVREDPLMGAGAGLIKGAGGLEPDTTLNAATRPTAGEGGAHNMFLQTWRALGVLGLAGLSLALAAAAIAGVDVIRRSIGPTRVYGAALLASLAVVVLSLQLVDAPFERQLWLLVGLLMAVAANARRAGWAWTRALERSAHA